MLWLNYTGNPIAVQSPSPELRGLSTPTLALPIDRRRYALASISRSKPVPIFLHMGYRPCQLGGARIYRFSLLSATFTTSQALFPKLRPVVAAVLVDHSTVTFQDPSTVGSPIYSGRTCAMTVGTAASAYAYLTSPQKTRRIRQRGKPVLSAVECDVMFAVPAGTNGQFFIGFGDNCWRFTLRRTSYLFRERPAAWQLTS